MPRSHRFPVDGNARPQGASRPLAALLCLLLWAACVGSLKGEGLQTWNDVEYTALRSSKAEWTVGGTHRFRETIGDLYDRRFTTNFEYKIFGDVHMRAGYSLRNLESANTSFNENRLIAGIGYPIWKGWIAVEGSTLYERLLVPSPDFNRYKQQFEVSQPGRKLSPWVYQQFLFRQGAGFVRSRSRLGVAWRAKHYSFKAAYQFESRSVGQAWAPRHAIYTEIGINRPLWFQE